MSLTTLGHRTGYHLSKALDDCGSPRACSWFARLPPLLGAILRVPCALPRVTRCSWIDEWLMLLLLFLFFRSRASNLFNWGFAFKSILYPVRPLSIVRTSKTISPLAVSWNIFQHLYRIKLLRPHNDLKMYANPVTNFSDLFLRRFRWPAPANAAHTCIILLTFSNFDQYLMWALFEPSIVLIEKVTTLLVSLDLYKSIVY